MEQKAAKKRDINNIDSLSAELISNERLSVYWQIPNSKKKLVEDYFNQSFAELKTTMRIYDITDLHFNGQNAHTFQEVFMSKEQTNWLFKGLKPNRSYCVDIGVRLFGHKFFPLQRSNPVHTATWNNPLRSICEDKCKPNSQGTSLDWSEQVSTYSYYENGEGTEQIPLFLNKGRDQEVFPADVKTKDEYQAENKQPMPAGSAGPAKNHLQMNGRQKILLLSWEYPPHVIGGLARHVHGLAGGLLKKGYEIHVLTANPNKLPEEESLEGIYVHRVKPLLENDHNFISWIGGLNLAMEAKVRELACKHQFMFIHAHDWLVGACAIVSKQTLQIPLITTIHATEYGRNNGIYTEMQKFIHTKEKQLIHESDRLIVCSDYMKKELNQVFQADPESIHTIPNGVTENISTNDCDKVLENFPLQENKKFIFSIGRIVGEKGFDTLIQAASMMREKFPDVYFIIAGKGPLLEAYRNKVVELNLQNQVFFVGFVTEEQRDALLEKCAIAVFPSRYEPFGIVALEAMIKGKPTIVSDTGGLKGLVKNKSTGLLMIPGNAESFIEQASYLLNNEEKALQIGQEGKKAVREFFNWGNIAEQTRNVYEETLEKYLYS